MQVGVFGAKRSAKLEYEEAGKPHEEEEVGFEIDGPSSFVSRNLRRARSEAELREVLQHSGERTVVVEFGASWCHKCHQVLPFYLQLAKTYPDALFVIADVDHLPEAASTIRFTPTFTFFARGKKVDEFAGADKQRLSDRCWVLLSDASNNSHDTAQRSGRFASIVHSAALMAEPLVVAP